MQRARVSPQGVSYINAHPANTPAGGAADTGAIRRALDRWVYRVQISATQS
jgi:3-oxoacyl-(acyl-carrier-protein) synthase